MHSPLAQELKNKGISLLLGSNSLRRHELMAMCGFTFQIVKPSYNEAILDQNRYSAKDYVLTQAENKAKSIKIPENSVLICADTVVVYQNTILEKPKDHNEAKAMILGQLSDSVHTVITGVCISQLGDYQSFIDETQVKFNALNEAEVDFYLENFDVLDRAGSYGIQEFIGLVGVQSIIGDYYNIMGLPINKVYQAIKQITLSK
ncbi:MAG: Maf family protein [Bacteroidota bacterium]|nr:Maf family protein [Bacteroidota bacterium]